MAEARKMYEDSREDLRQQPRNWAITGVAGFIGSHLLEELLRLDQRVIGFDNFATGHRHNLDAIRGNVTPAQWGRFTMVEGDIGDAPQCRRLCAGVDYVLHHAAIGSVPSSIADPLRAHAVNVTGFVNVLTSARDAGVQRVVYASSSAVYGDDPAATKTEAIIGEPLSPYAVSKRSDELYARVFGRCYRLATVGFRYFNVFGARQDPNGPYAAVIPKWITAMLRGEPVTIHGDGSTTRDFCHVGDVVQANLLAAVTSNPAALNSVFNVGCGNETTLNELFEILRSRLAPFRPSLDKFKPVYGDFRAGDIHRSRASIDAIRDALGYEPHFTLSEGLDQALPWYRANLG